MCRAAPTVELCSKRPDRLSDLRAPYASPGRAPISSRAGREPCPRRRLPRSASNSPRSCRVFEDATLAAPVLADKLAVSTAEELLRIDHAAGRRQVADRAVAEQWGQAAPAARCATGKSLSSCRQ